MCTLRSRWVESNMLVKISARWRSLPFQGGSASPAPCRQCCCALLWRTLRSLLQLAGSAACWLTSLPAHAHPPVLQVYANSKGVDMSLDMHRGGALAGQD